MTAPPARWRLPAEVLQIGFARARVVMMNEAHSGLKRSVRTREVGCELIPVAHRAGVRHLAMEALSQDFAKEANRTRVVPPATTAGYLAQPEMRRLIQAALDHEFTLIAYEADLSQAPPELERLSRGETNWREQEQARNLGEVLGQVPQDAKLLVWCGNGHLTKQPAQDFVPMGYRFEQLTGIEPFALDQIATVDFELARGRPWEQWALEFAPVLEALGGTAGFLAAEAPPDWPGRGRTDAFLLSTDNGLQ